MNSSQARRNLCLYRPDTADAHDPAMAAALEEVTRDSELQSWFERHCAVQQALRAKFRSLPVPAQLKDAILAEHKIVRPKIWWQRPAWLTAAAAVVLASGLTWLRVIPHTPDRFADFRSRLVRTVLREYRMDIVTNDMTQVRQFLSQRGAPADYAVPDGLQRLSLTGAGLLRWRNHPVSMVCFDRGDAQMVFLFVMDRSAVKDPPPATPQVSLVNKLVTASWSRGDKTYILAGSQDGRFPDKYL